MFFHYMKLTLDRNHRTVFFIIIDTQVIIVGMQGQYVWEMMMG